MAAKVSQVAVATQEQLDQTISSYIAQGFTVMNRGPTTTTMFKGKEFKLIWAVIGFFLCLLPLFIYLIFYAMEKDQMVEIRLLPEAFAGSALAFKLSEDGQYWWDGSAWQDAETSVPPSAHRSEDGAWWWDGSNWHAVPTAAAQVSPPPLPPAPPAEQPPDVASTPEPDVGRTQADSPQETEEGE